MPSDPVHVSRAVIGGLRRQGHGADDPAVIEAQRAHRTELLARYVQKIVDQAPPLTQEQRDRIVALLRPTTTAGKRRSKRGAADGGSS